MLTRLPATLAIAIAALGLLVFAGGRAEAGLANDDRRDAFDPSLLGHLHTGRERAARALKAEGPDRRIGAQREGVLMGCICLIAAL